MIWPESRGFADPGDLNKMWLLRVRQLAVEYSTPLKENLFMVITLGDVVPSERSSVKPIAPWSTSFRKCTNEARTSSVRFDSRKRVASYVKSGSCSVRCTASTIWAKRVPRTSSARTALYTSARSPTRERTSLLSESSAFKFASLAELCMMSTQARLIGISKACLQSYIRNTDQASCYG